jgi:hypothetical protein
MGNNQMHEKVYVIIQKKKFILSWQPPHHGWLMLNTDNGAARAEKLGTKNAYIAE